MRAIMIPVLLTLCASRLSGQASQPARASLAALRPAAAVEPRHVSISVLPRTVPRSDKRISLTLAPCWDAIAKGPGLSVGLQF